MSIKPTLLNAVLEVCEKQGGPVHATDIARHYNIKSKKYSSQLWSYGREGLLKKAKKGGQSLYTLSPAGRKFLKEHPTVWSAEDVARWANGEINALSKEPKKTEGERIYTSVASDAINSISDLVENNEKLMATIRSINSMTALILRDNNERKE